MEEVGRFRNVTDQDSNYSEVAQMLLKEIQILQLLIAMQTNGGGNLSAFSAGVFFRSSGPVLGSYFLLRCFGCQIFLFRFNAPSY